MIDTLHIYVGYDHRESIAYHTFVHSIQQRSSMPVAIHPVQSSLFGKFYSRPRDPKQSNDFSFTRFLVPYLQGYSGWALFADCDMLMLTDIAELWSLRDTHKAVQVCQHDYVPKHAIKYLGQAQHPYRRKNWSSFMLMNCSHWNCRRLSPETVQNAKGLYLHQFEWCDEDRVGSLPLEWNWLVGEYKHNPAAKNVHFTVGGPWDKAFRDTDYSDLWYMELDSMTRADDTIEAKAG